MSVRLQATSAMFLLSLLVGCSSSKDAAVNGKENPPKPVRIDKSMGQAQPGEPFKIRDAHVRGNNLHIQVSYTGGCGEHDFELVSNQDYNNKYPSELKLFLSHQAKEDRCKSIVYDDLLFELDKVQQTGSGILTLRINDFKKPIKYVY